MWVKTRRIDRACRFQFGMLMTVTPGKREREVAVPVDEEFLPSSENQSPSLPSQPPRAKPSFPLGHSLHEGRLPIAQQPSHRVGLLLLLVLAEDVDVFR
jgi:hypothetical protein